MKPKIGDKIYIPSAFYISRGEDDVKGGLATISIIKESDFLAKDHYNYLMIGVRGFEGTLYNYRHLMEKQDKLREQFGEELAAHDPDINTPWIQSGDIVNGSIYNGQDVW